MKTSRKHVIHIGHQFRILLIINYIYGIILTLMDIHYSLDGSGFETTFLTDIQDIGYIKTNHYS